MKKKYQKVLCSVCEKPVHIDDAMLESGGGKKGLRISHVRCRIKDLEKECVKGGLNEQK